MPTQPDPNCPSCKEPMEEGFVQVHTRWNIRVAAQWVKGRAQRSLWGGLKPGVTKQLAAYRCPKCGLVQHYALW